MKNFHIKSLILGLGIGFILTSIISLIYTSGIGSTKMSNQEIIAQAKQLGMVEDTQFIGNSSDYSGTQMVTSTGAASVKPDADKLSSQQSIKIDGADSSEGSNTDNQEVIVSINPGDSSETVAQRLLREGLISDEAAFMRELESMGLASDINIGEFKIKKGTEISAIIKTITGNN